MTLRNTRILSSCNDASNKQSQKMNVNIRVNGSAETRNETPIIQTIPEQRISRSRIKTRDVDLEDESYTAPTLRETVQPNKLSQSLSSRLQDVESVNISLRDRELEIDEPIDSVDAMARIQDLETKNKFLNLLLTVFQNNPLYINKYVVCESNMLMNMVKLLTGADSVDLILDEDGSCSCGGKNKLIYVSRIIVNKNNKMEDLKSAYNDIYNKLISYGISLKIVC